MRTSLPRTGIDRDELLATMKGAKAADTNWREGRSWSLVYHGGDEHEDLLAAVYRLFIAENGLSPTAFPSLRRFEAETVAMLLDLMEAPEGGVGSMTSGGTESILLAVKTYRDRWRAEGGTGSPEIVLPVSAHPAFLKAASYFDVCPVLIPVDDHLRADVAATEAAIAPRTICVVASAPSYPHGMVDPVAPLGDVAVAAGVGLHVDACLGGMLLPFLRCTGRPTPRFDFSVPGVTSMSVDLHKYGFAPKGASSVLYRDAALQRHQFFAYGGWPGGLYGSPSMAGTRPGGIIAAAWATLMSLGVEGYIALARRTIALTDELLVGLRAIPGIRVLGDPDMSVLAFTSDLGEIFAIARRMHERGWRVDRQRSPDAIHLIVTPNHEQAVRRFLDDLAAVAEVEAHQPSHTESGSAVLYGVTAEIPRGSDVEGFIRDELVRTYATVPDDLEA